MDVSDSLKSKPNFHLLVNNIKTMNKKELIQLVAAKCGMPQAEASKSLSAILETISEVLTTEESIVLQNFGTFSVKERAARRGINPKTKQSLDIPAMKVIRFKASKKS